MCYYESVSTFAFSHSRVGGGRKGDIDGSGNGILVPGTVVDGSGSLHFLSLVLILFHHSLLLLSFWLFLTHWMILSLRRRFLHRFLSLLLRNLFRSLLLRPVYLRLLVNITLG